MYFKQLYDPKLAQYSYLVGCQATGEAIVIDPLRDIDPYQELAEQENLQIVAAADTHIHADYLSGLREFSEQGVKVYASDEGGPDWKYEWLKDGSYRYELIKGGDRLRIGNLRFEVVHTPGHTPESVSFLLTDRKGGDGPMGMFTGDFVFVGDVGRPDLLETAAGQKGAMKPAARELYRSIEKFKKLPEYLQVWPAHGSGSACGKALGAVPKSTVGYELRSSPAFEASSTEENFVRFILEGQPEPPLYFGRMKKVNKEGPALLGDLEKPGRVSVRMAAESEGVVVDTRDRHRFMKGHIPGSLLAAYDRNFNTVAGSYIDADVDIYLVIEEENLEPAIRDLVRVGLDRIKGYVPVGELESWEGELESVESLDMDSLSERAVDPETLVVDVRKGTEYAEGHLPDSLNIAHTRLAAHLEELPRDKELLVHCASGQRASYAVALLLRNGFRVRWVDGEFTARRPQNRGVPVEQ